MHAPLLSISDAGLKAQSELLLSSHLKVTGKALLTNEMLEQSNGIVDTLMTADFAVVSHGLEANPIFNYGNRCALSLFELTWDEFTSLPSARSAEAIEQTERNALLTQVTKFGFIDNYQGVRISASGKRFFIEKAMVWNVIDENESYQGQAAALYEWTYID